MIFSSQTEINIYIKMMYRTRRSWADEDVNCDIPLKINLDLLTKN